MKWAVVKVIINTGRDELIGCIVGPFETSDAAKVYAEKAMHSALGYERWLVRELQTPSQL